MTRLPKKYGWSNLLQSGWNNLFQPVLGTIFPQSAKLLAVLVVSFLCLLAPTAPAIIDFNSNGLSDLWERQYNDDQLYPATYNPQADDDQDGWTNAQEADAGTDPAEANPPAGHVQPEITVIPVVCWDPDEDGIEEILTPETLLISWPTIPGKHYTLLSSPDLAIWLPIPQTFIGTGNIIEYYFPLTQPDRMFWRVAVTDVDTDGDTLSDAEERQIGSSPYFGDTNGNGTADGAEFTAGNDPSADTPDANCDGIPDNRIYSIMIETLSESKELRPLPWHTALTGVDNDHRYLTKVYSETYSVTNSPEYQTVENAVYSLTNTCINANNELEAQPTKVEGIESDIWRSTHRITMPPGEVIVWGNTQTTETTTPPTATVTTKTTTEKRSWTVRKNDRVIRNGTETMVETIRSELFDSMTVQELWNRFKARSWIEDQFGWQKSAPPGGIETADIDAEMAGWIRERYISNETTVFDYLSWPSQNAGSCGDLRMKAMRWRWVRFNPQNPGQYDYTAPPVGYSRSFHFLVMRWDRDFKTHEWPDAGLGFVELRCEGGTAAAGWNNVEMTRFAPYREPDPWKLATMDFTSGGQTQTFIQGVPAGLLKRMAVIPDDDAEDTTYQYESVSTVPREVPLPGVEIYQKDISEDQITLSAKVYDPVADVLASTSPQVWVNSRSEELDSGDKPGVYRLQGHSYQLYPGRNEITIAVENMLGARGWETLVVEGDEESGYALIGEPVRVPSRPTCPLVFAAQGEDATQVTLKVGTKSAQPDFEYMEPGPFGEWWYRTKPFLSILKPAGATPDRIADIPAGKPLLISELEDNVTIEITFPGAATSILDVPQSGVELSTPEAVQISETTAQAPTLAFKARGMGDSPVVKAALVTYRGEEAQQDVGSDILTAYQDAFVALPAAGKDSVVSFDVTDLEYEEGYNGLAFGFGDSPFYNHLGRHDSFRYPAPTKAGVRVFSANRKADAVMEGVTGRPQDIWYPVASEANLTGLGDALIKSGCQIVGMTDVKGCFDDAPLKRSFLVRGPPGRTFQAFDELYTAQGRTQRSQTFDADGTHGAALATALNRVQADEDLPASAKNALGLEIAGTYQFHNGFEDLVPKTHQAYVDPGNGTQQPNSWTMRGSSLPDDLQSNPSPWTVTSTLSDPLRAASASGKVKIDTTAENTAYYATTSATAPWNLTGPRAVTLRFKLTSHDAANGADGAFQLAAGDGTRTWTCQVAPSQIKVQGTAIALPAAKFPTGLIDGKFHTLQFNLSGIGNNAIISIDGEVLTTTAAAQTGTLNGIAFGDPGAGLAGKFETESLGFENSELKYEYGNYDADDYADSDEIDNLNNVLLYLRSKGQAFRTSAIARWLRILDPRVYEWLLEEYTGKSNDGSEQELHILANKDVWLGSTVDMEVATDYGSIFSLWDSKVTNTLVLDKEETKIWSTDRTREDMELAGILMGWVYSNHQYKAWLAILEGRDADAILIEKKHLVENIVKCAKRVETTLEVGGEIAISMTNEIADYAITIKDISQGEYMAMVGFIPLVPSSTAKVFKFLKKADGAVIESIHQLSTKLDDFPGGVITHVDSHGITRRLEKDKVFADATDLEAVSRARKITDDIPVSVDRPGSISGKEVLSTFANGSVTIFKTKEPLKVYRVYKDGGKLESNFFLFEKPQSLNQVVADQALMNPSTGLPWQNYDRYIEVDIPAGQYVYLGHASKMTSTAPGGGTQIWVDDVTVSNIDWVTAATTATNLPQ